MAAIDMSLVARSELALHHLIKRKNWAAREPGVIVVFAIVGAVAILLFGLFIQKKVNTTNLVFSLRTLSNIFLACRPQGIQSIEIPQFQ